MTIIDHAENAKREERGYRLALHYAHDTGRPEQEQETYVDAITDILHAAHANCAPWWEVLRNVELHAAFELGEGDR